MNDKTNTKKLFKWEGKKEILWIIGFLALFLLIWAYYSETKSCRAITKTECYKDCEFFEIVSLYRQENPGVSMDCNVTTKTCNLWGVAEGSQGYDLNDMINFSYHG